MPEDKCLSLPLYSKSPHTVRIERPKTRNSLQIIENQPEGISQKSIRNTKIAHTVMRTDIPSKKAKPLRKTHSSRDRRTYSFTITPWKKKITSYTTAAAHLWMSNIPQAVPEVPEQSWASTPSGCNNSEQVWIGSSLTTESLTLSLVLQERKLQQHYINPLSIIFWTHMWGNMAQSMFINIPTIC